MTHVKKTLKRFWKRIYVCVCIHIKLNHFAVYWKQCKSTICELKNRFLCSLLRSLPWMSPSWHSPSSLYEFLCCFVDVFHIITYQTVSFFRAEPVSYLSSYCAGCAYHGYCFILKWSVNFVEWMKWSKIDKDSWNCQSCGFSKEPISFAWWFVINGDWASE